MPSFFQSGVPEYPAGDFAIGALRMRPPVADAPGSPGVDLTVSDSLEALAGDWPRGKAQLALSVERDGHVIDLPAFSPVTVGLYPTQLYETVSMVLLILLLLAYYPYRRHDGQLMVVLMIGYAVHRFINESLRIEPTVGGTVLTLSQWGSVVIFLAAVGIEIYLWRVMPSRWSGAALVAGAERLDPHQRRPLG